jgi:hypothetical protein
MSGAQPDATTPPARSSSVTLWTTPTLTAWAYFVGDTLVFAGRDTGPSAAYMSADGEYEYRLAVGAEHVLTITKALGGQPGDDVLALLERAGETIVRRGERHWLGDLGIYAEYGA